MTTRSGRGICGFVGCALAGALTLTACTPGPHGGHGPRTLRSPGATGHPPVHQQGRTTGLGSSAGQEVGCLVAIHGVIYGPGRLLPTWLPAGFHRAAATQSGLTAPTENYTLATNRHDPPRIAVGFATDPRPFGRFSGGRPARQHPSIQGHRGRLESGPPAAKIVSVYWKPDAVHLLSVTGYKVPAAVVLTVARNVWFDPPGLVPLPLSAGPVISKDSAIELARRASDVTSGRSNAKLSSWAEVSAMLRADHAGAILGSVPDASASERWQPVWTVLVTDDVTGATALVLIDAATGQPVVTAPVSGRPAWFSALTDRSRAVVHRCQGGSRALLPFGVLTRNEEAFVVGAGFPRPLPGAEHAQTTIALKLTTVPAMNSADPGIYGGCVAQSCSINELTWVIITKVRADPGTTVACLPTWAGPPQGYRPSQVRQYFWVSVPAGNYGIYCRTLPGPLENLRDLSPPLLTGRRDRR